MTSPQNFYEAERPLMGTHQLWVPIGPTIQAGIEIAQSQVFFYQSSGIPKSSPDILFYSSGMMNHFMKPSILHMI